MERPGSTRIISMLPEGTWVKGPDLRLMGPVNDLNGIPTAGKSVIILAVVDQVLHLRLFDADGKMVADTDEKALTDRASKVDDLKEELEDLWPPHQPTPSEKFTVVTTVTALLGPAPLNMGDLVCELDSADFRDELRLQQIRCYQAQSWVEQAKSLLEVSEISLSEYQDGIHPQDVQLIRQYIETCRVEAERTARAYVWSKETTAKGYRSSAQLKADQLAMQQAQIALHEAEGMELRLEKYTAPKLITNLKAKIAAIRSDKLAQEQSFGLEKDRLEKLEKMVAYCTVRAPSDGIVVYANVPNRFGQIENPVQEGATVRQGQSLFFLPDPNHMQVKAKVNETKVALIRTGQKARIVVDAFPDRPMWGTVSEITGIPAPASAAADVRIYYAVVKIEGGGFSDLRPGLSAEVTFVIDKEPRVATRVPLQAVRWVDGKPFVAVVSSPAAKPDSARKELSWQWQSVVLGASDTTRFEVVSGLKPGEKVIAQPELLPPPPSAKPHQNVAATDKRAEG
jgi:multidrug resistance efflux pump